MIRSSASHTADDVSIPCRMRRSVTEQSSGDSLDMTITMRQWSAAENFLVPRSTVKELLLTPMRSVLTARDDSPERGGINASFTIPMADILIVETKQGKKQHVIYVTTLSLGYFALDCLTRNGQDILLAFLRTAVPKERFREEAEDTATIRSTASTLSCLDIDALTDQQMKGRAESETWPEKFSRRMGKMVHSLTEMSHSLCVVVSCCQEADTEQRDAAPAQCRRPTLEMDEEYSNVTTPSMASRRQKMKQHYRMPSNGRAIETCPEEIESTYHEKE